MSPLTSISAAQIEEMLSHREWLTRLAYRLVGNRADADDLVQTAFERTLRRSPRRPEAMRAWMARILRHLAYNLQRDRIRADRRIRTREDVFQASDKFKLDQVTEAAQKVEIERIMLDEIVRLPDCHRDPLLLRFERGLSHKEVGRELGIAEDAARKRVGRAILRLRERVSRRMGKDWQGTMGLAFSVPLPLPLSLAAAVAAAAGLVSATAWFLLQPAAAPEQGVSAAALSPQAIAPANGQDLPDATSLAFPAATPGSLIDDRPRIAFESPDEAGLSDPWAWSGRVTDTSGSPVPGVVIVAFRGRAHQVFPVPSGGAYSIQLDPSWDPERTSLFPCAPDVGVGRRVYLGEKPVGAALDLVVEHGTGYQEIRVSDGHGSPVEDVAVWIREADRTSFRVTGASGLVGFHLPDDRNFTVSVWPRGFGRYVHPVQTELVQIHAQRQGADPLEIRVELVPERFRLQALDPITQLPIAGTRFFTSVEQGSYLDEIDRFTELPAAGPGLLDHPNPFPGSALGVWMIAPGSGPRYVVMDRETGASTPVSLDQTAPARLLLLQGNTAPATGVEVEWSVSRPALGLAAAFERRRGTASYLGRSWTDPLGRIEWELPADLSHVFLSFSASRNGVELCKVGQIDASKLPEKREWTWQLAPELIPVELQLLDYDGDPLPGYSLIASLGLVPHFDDLSATFGRQSSGVRTGAVTQAVTGPDGLAHFRLNAGATVSWSLNVGDPEEAAKFGLSTQEEDLLPTTGSVARTLRTALGSRSVTGTILYADGSPVEAGLVVEVVAPTSPATPGMKQVALALTGEAGSFAVRRLPGVLLQLAVQNSFNTLANFELDPADPHPVFRLPTFWRLVVRPLDPVTSMPIAGMVRSTFRTDEGFDFFLSTGDGENQVFDQLPMGDGWLTVRSPERIPFLHRVTAGTNRVDAILAPGRQVRVELGYPGFQLPEEVRCFFAGEELENPGWRLRRSLDGKGGLILRGAPLGAFELILRGSSGEPVREPIRVPA